MPVIAPPTLRESIHSALPAPGKWANWWSTHLSTCWIGASLIMPCESHHGTTGTQKNGKRLSTQYGGTELARTLFEKIWDNHVVCPGPDGSSILYIDLHLVHEVTSPQAFEGLRIAGRSVRRPEFTFATMDHNVPTTHETRSNITDVLARSQMEALRKNCREFAIELFDLDSPDQGIVHVIGPELGLTQPGRTIVCGDSHTSTHGAFGALAFGIGTSEVEHVLATQTLLQRRPRTMEVRVDGKLPPGVGAKDVVLAFIAKVGVGGATGYVLEYRGTAIEA